MDPYNAQRIMIIGSAGSGKSWLSKRLADITGYPLTHLDNEFWRPGWVKTPREEWTAKQQQMISGENWILDGNYGSTMELRYAAADLVIFLDMGRVFCLWNVFRRHGKKRSDLPGYLEEKMDHEFFDFLRWVWSFPKTDRKIILDMHERYPDTPFIVLCSRKAERGLLAAWGSAFKERSVLLGLPG